MGVARVNRWLCGASAAIFLFGCGGTVIEGGPGSDGGATNTGGGRGVSGGTSVGKGGVAAIGGKPATGGKPGAGGKTSGGSISCALPFTECSPDGCFDLQSDVGHCGSCFNTCPSNGTCVNGTCQITLTGTSLPPIAKNCPPHTVYCGNFAECLDTSSNAFACGSCNTPCNNGNRCTNGVCDPNTCLSPTATLCPSGGGRCIELASDMFNCGACDKACTPPELCRDGKCAPPECGAPLQYCPQGGCTDTSSDLDNCGSCGTTCLPGPDFDTGAYACNNGTCGCSFTANKCGKACASSFWYCPPDGFMGQPADLCKQTARNGYEACACDKCLAEIQACFGSVSCINSMDCTLSGPCSTCQPVFNACTDKNGNVDPIADKFVACLNAQCSKS
jgi:hypothetical protein